MPVRVIDNSAQIKAQTTQKVNIFLRLMTEEIIKISTPKTPKRPSPIGGSLRNNIRKQVLGLTAKIEWAVNYAAVQELVQHKNYSTSGTGPHFAENAVEEGRNRIGKIAKMSGLI